MRLILQNRYPIPAGKHRFEEEISRSRFITCLKHVEMAADAKAFVDELREEFADASHHCWAYLIGPPGSSAQVGMSDDGEPHGTAGRPMLKVLSHCGVGDIAAVVVRYFGGTKLGKGGLVRAYGGGVQQALKTLPTTERMDYRTLKITIEYHAVKTFQKLAGTYELKVLDEAFAADVTYRLAVPGDKLAQFVDEMTGVTNGKLVVTEDP